MRGILRAATAFAAVLVLAFALTSRPATANSRDVETLALLWSRSDGHNATMWSVRWSPNGTMLSTTFFDNTTVIWNSTTGQRIMKLGSHENRTSEPRTRCDGNSTCTIPEHLPTRITAWSPDGKYLAIGGDDTLIHVYNTSTWTLHRILRGHKGSVLTLDFSPDGRYLASGSGTDKVSMHNVPENMIKIWDFERGVAIANLTGHRDGVMEVRWSRNGSRLVSASDDKTLKMWDTATWNNTINFTGHAGGVLAVDWSPDETKLISGSRDYKARLWNATSGELIATWQAPNCIRSVDWHFNNQIIVTSGVSEVMVMIRNSTSGVVIKTLDSNRGPAGPRGAIMSARWSPDGKMLATASGKEGTVRVYAFGLATPPTIPLIPPWVPGVVGFGGVIAGSSLVTAKFILRGSAKIGRR